MLTVDTLAAHARRFGVDGIAATAVESHFPLDELTALIEQLDVIEVEHASRGKRFPTPKRHRLSAADRAKRLLGIEDDEKED